MFTVKGPLCLTHSSQYFHADVINLDDFPEHMKNLLKRINEDYEESEKQKEANLNMCRLKVFCQHPMEGKLIEKKLHIHFDDTLQDATERAYKVVK